MVNPTAALNKNVAYVLPSRNNRLSTALSARDCADPTVKQFTATS